MAGWRGWIWPVVGLAGLAALILWLRPPEEAPVLPAPELVVAAPADSIGFDRVTGPLELELPRDHGPHLEFQTEWWYYTGNLVADDGRRFAYQLTFFRRGLLPGESNRAAALAAQQIYFAHFAITDVEADRHQESERFSRGAAGLAGAMAQPLRVWLESWQMTGLSQDGSHVRLKADAEDMTLDLELEALKPAVLHGDNGLSAKSGEAGNASYYLGYTRMATTGEISIAGERFEVVGDSWHDHEWSTSALGPAAVGWDWFSLQLDDGSELMLFQIRQADGSLEPVSSGTYVDADGSYHPLTLSQFTIEPQSTWMSQASGVVYPSGWLVRVPELQIELWLRPLIEDQEMNVSFVYWEGAVEIAGEAAGRDVSGFGFVELTGYGESMQGVF